MDSLQELKERFDTIVRKLQETIREAESTRAEIDEIERERERDRPVTLKAPHPQADEPEPI
jgi:hypothetical protein